MSTPIQATASYTFNASPEAVFDAWVTGKHVRNWFGPGLGEVTRVAIDAREGGSFIFVQRRGMDDVEHTGTYLEYIRPERLVFTWLVKDAGQSSKVSIDFSTTASGCQVTLTHHLQPQFENYRERVTASWSKMLTAMAASIDSK